MRPVKLAGKPRSRALFSTWQKGAGVKKHSGNYFTYNACEIHMHLPGWAGWRNYYPLLWGFFFLKINLFLLFQLFDTSSVPMPLDMMMTRTRRRRTWGGGGGGLGVHEPMQTPLELEARNMINPNTGHDALMQSTWRIWLKCIWRTPSFHEYPFLLEKKIEEILHLLIYRGRDLMPTIDEWVQLYT